MVRGRPGRAPQTTKREWFARLIVQGVPSAAACRIVGVNPRTARELAITTLRLVIETIAEGNTTLAAAILDQVAPESPDNTAPTVAGCIGTALGLLDDYLTGNDPRAPSPPSNCRARPITTTGRAREPWKCRCSGLCRRWSPSSAYRDWSYASSA